jgi:hypothetical protein
LGHQNAAPTPHSRYPTRPGSCAAETTALGPTGARLGGLPGGGGPADGAPSPVALYRAVPKAAWSHLALYEPRFGHPQTTRGDLDGGRVFKLVTGFKQTGWVFLGLFLIYVTRQAGAFISQLVGLGARAAPSRGAGGQ